MEIHTVTVTIGLGSVALEDSCQEGDMKTPSELTGRLSTTRLDDVDAVGS